MSLTAGHGPYAREHPRHWHTKDVEELPEGWKDDMIRRQLEECSRQMTRLTDSTIHTPRRDVDENMRAQDARTLATLRREVKELLKMENDCAVRRRTRSAESSEDVVARLERRLRELLEREQQARLLFQPKSQGSEGNR
jgi:BMFP domain-containing protein YqiC